MQYRDQEKNQNLHVRGRNRLLVAHLCQFCCSFIVDRSISVAGSPRFVRFLRSFSVIQTRGLGGPFSMIMFYPRYPDIYNNCYTFQLLKIVLGATSLL